MKTRRTLIHVLVALTCVGCSEEEPAVNVVISDHSDAEAEPVLNGSETISLTYLHEPFAQSHVANMRVEWKVRAGEGWRTISSSPSFSAGLLKPGVHDLHVTISRAEGFYDSGWRRVRVVQPKPSPKVTPPAPDDPTLDPGPSTQPSAELPAVATDSPEAASASGSGRGLSGALGE